MLAQATNFMECALSLAKLALGYTSPNPAVGAVIVKEEDIIGLGYTQPPGSTHAEVMALSQAGAKARGATMYVTLEPCCHYGYTPPCTKTIIDAGISKVHIAILDPNPLVSGQGVKELEKAGVKIYLGECEQGAYELNEAYIKFITTGLPFVIAKFAMSLDGKLATKSGDSKWISSDEARKYIHNLRHTVDAIMVGINTVMIDNPKLTARSSSGKGGKMKLQPLRVIVDGKGRVPLTAQIFKEPGNVLIAASDSLNIQKVDDLGKVGAETVQLPTKEGLVDLEELLRMLGRRKVTSILVEGGGALLGSLFDQGLVDKVLAFVSPIIIGGDEAKTVVGGKGVSKVAEALQLNRIKVEKFDNTILISGYTK